METINLQVPNSWTDLDERQLLYVFTIIACEYPSDTIKTFAIMRWNNIEVLDPVGIHEYLIKQGKEKFIVSSVRIAELIQSMNWITEVPGSPVRLASIKGHDALPADFQEVPFEKFIMCDNLYQGYLHIQNPELLDELLCLLYNINEPTGFTKAQQVNAFYWWAALKKHLASIFRFFFTQSDGEDPALGKNLYDKLSRSMNNQIRALTKGDITKEKEVLAMDTWRALPELDAQVKDYEDIKRNSK